MKSSSWGVSCSRLRTVPRLGVGLLLDSEQVVGEDVYHVEHPGRVAAFTAVVWWLARKINDEFRSW